MFSVRAGLRVVARVLACSPVPVGFHMFAGGRGCLRCSLVQVVVRAVMRLFTRSRGWSRAHAFACARGCSLVRMFPWVFTCSRVVVGVCGCSLVPVVVRAVVRWFTRSRGWSRAHAFVVARGCSRVRMFTLVFESIIMCSRGCSCSRGCTRFARVVACSRGC